MGTFMELAGVNFNREHTVPRKEMLIEKDGDYERYMRLRAVGKELNSKLADGLQKKDINRCGEDLGILKKNILIFENEDDVAVLREYCIHNPSGKKSRIDHYIEQSSLEAVSDEVMLLKALREAFRHCSGEPNGEGLSLLRRRYPPAAGLPADRPGPWFDRPTRHADCDPVDEDASQ